MRAKISWCAAVSVSAASNGSLFQLKQWHSNGRAAYPLNTHLSLPNELSPPPLWPQGLKEWILCVYIYNYIYNGACVWWCHWFLVISVFHFLSAALATDSNCNQCCLPYLVCALLCCKASTSQSKIPWPLGRKNSTRRAHQVRLQRVCYIISGRLIGRAASIVAVWQPNSTEVGSQNRFWAALSTSADAKIIPTPSCTAKGFCRITKGRSTSHLVALAINLSWNLFSWISAGVPWHPRVISAFFRPKW